MFCFQARVTGRPRDGRREMNVYKRADRDKQGDSEEERLYIFTNPSARAGYDPMSIFKRGLTGLNSEFSFS